jgi:hypothetical protein
MFFGIFKPHNDCLSKTECSITTLTQDSPSLTRQVCAMDVVSQLRYQRGVAHDVGIICCCRIFSRRPKTWFSNVGTLLWTAATIMVFGAETQTLTDGAGRTFYTNVSNPREATWRGIEFNASKRMEGMYRLPSPAQQDGAESALPEVYYQQHVGGLKPAGLRRHLVSGERSLDVRTQLSKRNGVD